MKVSRFKVPIEASGIERIVIDGCELANGGERWYRNNENNWVRQIVVAPRNDDCVEAKMRLKTLTMKAMLNRVMEKCKQKRRYIWISGNTMNVGKKPVKKPAVKVKKPVDKPQPQARRRGGRFTVYP